MSNQRFDDDLSIEEEERRQRLERRQDVRGSAQEAVRRASGRGQRRESGGFPGLLNSPGSLIAVAVAGLAVLGLVGYLLFGRSDEQPRESATVTQPAARATPAPADTGAKATPTAAPPEDTGQGSTFTDIFQSQPASTETTESWPARIARIALKLALSALLAAMLAFRPRKDLPAYQRNPYVAQTQILLAVVAAAMMMVVADNAARAFGIFAAASLVRFRTNIRDPKEITVLLVSLGIGLAAGVGRWELSIILALFVLLMLYVLEYYEPTLVYRTMELTITTRSVTETDDILKEIFEKRQIDAEIRKVDREDENDPLGTISYTVSVNPTVSTDQLSEEIFSADPENIDSVKWDQKKSTSYVYR